MNSITDTMLNNHRHCDASYADAEGAVAAGEWEKAIVCWRRFRDELYNHIDEKEEAILFSAFEAINGLMGPTVVMRGEHQQMRALVTQMDSAIAARDGDRFLGIGEQLLITIAQHNMKEEQILYPMMDERIPNAADLAKQIS